MTSFVKSLVQVKSASNIQVKMFSFFKNQKLIDEASDTLLIELNKYARNPKFFGDEKVTDDPDGRFEMVALFATPFFVALSGRDEFSSRISQKLFDKIFKSFDDAMRLLGVGDLAVGKRIKSLSESFYGRQKSYKEAIESGDSVLFENKIALNVFSKTVSDNKIEKILCEEVLALYGRLKQLPTAEILANCKK